MMDLTRLREELELDVAWRLDEIRHLRNALLGGLAEADWPVSAMRAILVMQYAHLEGLTRTIFGAYIQQINELNLTGADVQPQLRMASFWDEWHQTFSLLQDGPVVDDAKFLRRAQRQVAFMNRLSERDSRVLLLDADAVLTLEMNLGRDVLQRTLYSVAIPPAELAEPFYKTIEFIRRTRNTIAHGARQEKIEVSLFRAHQQKAEKLMDELIALVMKAARSGWYLTGAVEMA